jgi:hypothetical protein
MQPASPSAQETIAALRAEFGGRDSNDVRAVPKSRVLEWMRSPDLEVRGALYSMITDAERAARIKPALQFEDYYAFVLDYLEQCIEEGPDGEWTDSRYLAGHQLVAWINNFWNNEAVPRARLTEIKHRLANLYKRGDEDVRDAVLNGVLEHLFENRQVANYFSDWERDPALARVYDDALLWRKKKLGGESR